MGKERLKDPKHPAQKPLKLIKHLMGIASNDGDLVYDPFMGVGTTCVAAIEMNRRYIGVEIDKVFYDAASNRIEETKERYNY